MSTTRVKATIIGLLFSIFAIVAVVSYRESSQAQDAGPSRQLLPLVSGGDGVQSSDAEESPVEHEHQEEQPPDELDVPVEEGPPAGEVIPPEELERMREEALEIAANMQIIPARGFDTAGFTITVAGQDIKLPDNVYIEADIGSINCVPIPDHPCDAEVPAYVLRYIDDDAQIVVGQVTGKIMDYSSTQEQKDANRAAFQWLIDIVESEQ